MEIIRAKNITGTGLFHTIAPGFTPARDMWNIQKILKSCWWERSAIE
jgi:hypothetical protein